LAASSFSRLANAADKLPRDVPALPD